MGCRGGERQQGYTTAPRPRQASKHRETRDLPVCLSPLPCRVAGIAIGPSTTSLKPHSCVCWVFCCCCASDGSLHREASHRAHPRPSCSSGTLCVLTGGRCAPCFNTHVKNNGRKLAADLLSTVGGGGRRSSRCRGIWSERRLRAYTSPKRKPQVALLPPLPAVPLMTCRTGFRPTRRLLRLR